MATQLEIPGTLAVTATPGELLRLAVTQGAGLDKLEQLMELQQKWEANEARKVFIEAMSAFKSHAITVTKDKTNKQYDSSYVSLGNLIGTVTPFLSQHGLSARWDIDQSAPPQIKITCIITHSQGHSESVAMICPPDTSGQKNPIQQIKSAITYAKACTFESICGLAASDANVDDDGNGATSNGELAEQIEWMMNAEDSAELKRLYKNAYEKFEENPAALKAIVAARKKKQGEFDAN